MKRVASIMLTAVILICSLVLPASASYNSSLDTSADIAFLVSLDDGTVIFDKNADKKAAPASLTKIVTAILTIENCADLDTVITIKQSSLDLLRVRTALLPGSRQTRKSR